jgi:hypothetical protein
LRREADRHAAHRAPMTSRTTSSAVR